VLILVFRCLFFCVVLDPGLLEALNQSIAELDDDVDRIFSQDSARKKKPRVAPPVNYGDETFLG
jgi:hypothetical protein